jgi:hypothetical protein
LVTQRTNTPTGGDGGWVHAVPNDDVTVAVDV